MMLEVEMKVPKSKNKRKFCPFLRDLCLEGNCAIWTGRCGFRDIATNLEDLLRK